MVGLVSFARAGLSNLDELGVRRANGMVGAPEAPGLASPLAGALRFRDHDRRKLSPAFRDVLGGGCGLIPKEAALVPYASTTENILAPRRCDERTANTALVAVATVLARRCRLPGRPAGDPAAESAAGRPREACVRAVPGEPLLVVEAQAKRCRGDLVAPLVSSMQGVRDCGSPTGLIRAVERRAPQAVATGARAGGGCAATPRRSRRCEGAPLSAPSPRRTPTRRILLPEAGPAGLGRGERLLVER
ncbi:MAG: hypothetical protein ACLFTG_02385, partial [Alphaproteobacteria bacterium]